MLVITGSPRRNGNTAAVAGWVAEGAREAGALVELVNATTLQMQTVGCSGCMECQQTEPYRCSITDDISTLVHRLPEQDWVILATPVYFMGFSAQLKVVVDRMHCLIKYKPAENRLYHALANTRFALVATGGGDYSSGLNVLDQSMKQIMEVLHKSYRSLILDLMPIEEGRLLGRTDVRNKALAFGAELARS
jgi:multimeric flavodoxin WrbA